jgi:hypothetical protein
MHVIVKNASLPLFLGMEAGDPPGNNDLKRWRISPSTSLLVVSPRAAMTMQRTPSGLATTIQGGKEEEKAVLPDSELDFDLKSSGIETKYSGTHSWSAKRKSDFRCLDLEAVTRESGTVTASMTISFASGVSVSPLSVSESIRPRSALFLRASR